MLACTEENSREVSTKENGLGIVCYYEFGISGTKVHSGTTQTCTS